MARGRDGTDTQILHTDTFKRGLGKFIFNNWEKSPEVRTNEKDYPYIITTNRELEHYNCGAMTRRTGNGEILTEDVLLINPDDAARTASPRATWCAWKARAARWTSRPASPTR
jgi:formate dehydrogenase major subunit